jgi:hypothetical protein
MNNISLRQRSYWQKSCNPCPVITKLFTVVIFTLGLRADMFDPEDSFYRGLIF